MKSIQMDGEMCGIFTLHSAKDSIYIVMQQKRPIINFTLHSAKDSIRPRQRLYYAKGVALHYTLLKIQSQSDII